MLKKQAEYGKMYNFLHLDIVDTLISVTIPTKKLDHSKVREFLTKNFTEAGILPCNNFL